MKTIAMATVLAVGGSWTAEAGERTAFKEATPLIRLPQPVRNGNNVALGVTLYTARGALPNQIVKFYVKVSGQWVYVGQARTNVHGRASLSPRIFIPGLVSPRRVTLPWAPVFSSTSRYNGTDARNGMLGTGFVVIP